MTARYLIVNADDFGQSPGINLGIAEAHERGIVTSTSLMVRGRAAEGAADYAREHPLLALGWHFDLGEWAFRGGRWMALYQHAPAGDPMAVNEEACRQLEIFRRLAGCDPTHIDSHQHAHTREPARSTLIRIARTLGIPLRHYSHVCYCGRFYGQTAEGQLLPSAIEPNSLAGILRNLPSGWTELGCHPGCGRDLDTMYQLERKRELETLCAPAVHQAIRDFGIELRSFREITGGRCVSSC